jgi:hypothetical protein
MDIQNKKRACRTDNGEYAERSRTYGV